MTVSTARPIFIGGEWKAGRGATFASVNPSTGEPVAEIAGATPADVDEAVAVADRTWRTPAWRNLLPHERARVIYRIGEQLDRECEDLARLQTSDNGKPITETRALVRSAANTFRYFASVLETMEGEVTPPRGPYLTMSQYVPYGVVAAITPWNSPVASEAQKVAPALAAGNAVILKPSQLAPLLALELARVAHEVGLPPGLFSVLPGPGRTVGDALVRHPLVRRVSFTGGTETGRSIGRLAAEKPMSISLELGGKSPTLVFEDAEIDHAVDGVIFGIFSSQGQSCVAGSRLYVHERIEAEFLEKLVARTRQLRIGDPDSERTQIGPLISREHRQEVADFVASALADGGRLLCGGAAPEDPALQGGFYYEPTILAGLSDTARVCREEIFGPVLVTSTFSDENEVIERANDSDFGLACGLWTRDYRRVLRVSRAMEAATVWINTYKQLSISAPFGGFKASGVGREKGRAGLLAYAQQQSLYWGLNESPIPWARS